MVKEEIHITKEDIEERSCCLEKTMERIKMVMSKDKVDRIKISNSIFGDEMVVDLHGLGTKDAIIFINNVVNLSVGECSLKLVHGYNNGDALKDMVRRRFKNDRVTARHSSMKNQGATVLTIG